MPRFTRRPLIRYSLATLLLAVAVMALLLAPIVNRVHRQERTIAAIEKLGGEIGYAHERQFPNNQSPGPRWLREWLGDDYFREVVIVDLQGKAATDELVEQIADFRSLGQLNLVETRITDRALPHLAKLKQLKALSIGFNPITNGGLAHLSQLNQLVYLDLSVTSIDDDGLSVLNRFPQLYQVHLYGTAITDRGAETLSRIQTVGELDVANTRITDAGLGHLANLSRLTRLRLDQMITGQGQELRITDAGLLHVAHMPKLADLGLVNLAITDQGLSHLQSSSTLERVSLFGCKGITRQGIGDLKNAISGLSIQQ